jgi:hypothetical protein
VERSVTDIARGVISLPVKKIRDLRWDGLPYTQTDLFPFDTPSMGMLHCDGPPAWRDSTPVVPATIVGTTTFDGGISFNMMVRDASRRRHAEVFSAIARDVLGPENSERLCSIYDIRPSTPDAEALQRICSFEPEIGFFAAALATAGARIVPATYLQIFDLPNVFPGPRSALGEFATHTFDIVTLLGGVHDYLLPASYALVIADWRDRILEFVRDGKAPCRRYVAGEGKALRIGKKGVGEVSENAYLEERRRALFELADRVDVKTGWDALWVDVCIRFLMKGE